MFMYLNVCICLCVCLLYVIGQEDFNLHVYSSVQKPKKVSGNSTAMAFVTIQSSGNKEAIDQESKLVAFCMEKIMMGCVDWR